MVIDCREWNSDADIAANRRRVFVDGVEQAGVWFVDTDAGLIKTYSLGDAGGPVLARNLNFGAIPNDWELEIADGRPVSRIVRGRVTLRPFE